MEILAIIKKCEEDVGEVICWVTTPIAHEAVRIVTTIHQGKIESDTFLTTKQEMAEHILWCMAEHNWERVM